MSLYQFLKVLGSDTAEDYAWMLEASCRGLDCNLMYPEKGDAKGIRVAKKMCASCPVKRQCLDFAMTPREGMPFEDGGIWGGTTARERQRMRSSWRRGGIVA